MSRPPALADHSKDGLIQNNSADTERAAVEEELRKLGMEGNKVVRKITLKTAQYILGLIYEGKLDEVEQKFSPRIAVQIQKMQGRIERILNPSLPDASAATDKPQPNTGAPADPEKPDYRMQHAAVLARKYLQLPNEMPIQRAFETLCKHFTRFALELARQLARSNGRDVGELEQLGSAHLRAILLDYPSVARQEKIVPYIERRMPEILHQHL